MIDCSETTLVQIHGREGLPLSAFQRWSHSAPLAALSNDARIKLSRSRTKQYFFIDTFSGASTPAAVIIEGGRDSRFRQIGCLGSLSAANVTEQH